jgi:hypothetical protein
MNIYRSITLSQYLYNAPLPGSARTQAKNRHNIDRSIGSVPIATFLDHQCVNVVERILKDRTHPITQKQTVKSHHNTIRLEHIITNQGGKVKRVFTVKMFDKKKKQKKKLFAIYFIN